MSESPCHVYRLLSEDKVYLTEDRDGCVSGGFGHEPAWSFRLWNGAVALSKFIETIATDKITQCDVVDLGAGTGLLSLVVSKCGARQVIATDMQHAMPLLRHNVSLNTQTKSASDTNISEVSYTLTCPGGHVLADAEADCEDYMCNVCDFDIDENDRMWRCSVCNFDICKNCALKVESQDISSLQTWYRLHLEEWRADSASSCCSSGSSSSRTNICACPYDWSDESALQCVFSLLEEMPLSVCKGRVIVASDVTYNQTAVQMFFRAVTDTTNKFFSSAYTCSDDTRPYIDLIFLHHSREASTEQLMLQLLLRLLGAFPTPESSVESRFTDKEVQCEVFEGHLAVASEMGACKGSNGVDSGTASVDGYISSAAYKFSAGMSIADSFPGVTVDCSTCDLVHQDTVWNSPEEAESSGGKMRIFLIKLHKV